MKAIHRLGAVLAFTLQDLIQEGIKQGATIHNGVVYHFTFMGFHVTHEHDNCYLVCLPEATLWMTYGHMLVVNIIDGKVTAKTMDIVEFNREYVKAE